MAKGPYLCQEGLEGFTSNHAFLLGSVPESNEKESVGSHGTQAMRGQKFQHAHHHLGHCRHGKVHLQFLARLLQPF